MSYPVIPIRPSRRRDWAASVLAIGFLLLAASHARATWSIIIIDAETKEVAVGSATCLTGFDLRQGLPVVLVDRGAACAQSRIDSGAINRMRIWDAMLAGTSPNEILNILALSDGLHQQRQYGIADARRRIVNFTGSGAGAYAGNIIGYDGNMYYAIQGNVLTGPSVLTRAEEALLGTDGDFVDKLSAAMEGAREQGGDGRCSCSTNNPTSCGAPPPDFEKSSHIAFMIVARTGDTDGVCNGTDGCASGDYFLNMNLAFQTQNDPDPVLSLTVDMIPAWRLAHRGRPDAVQSIVSLDPPHLPGATGGMTTMTITLRDYQQAMLTVDPVDLTIEHETDSAGISAIGEIVDLGFGIYEVQLDSAPGVGVDRFRITVDDGIRPVVLLPLPKLTLADPADADVDGDVDPDDYNALAACLAGPDEPIDNPACAPSDFNADTHVDLRDVASLGNAYTGAPCVFLRIEAPPVPSNIPCGDSIDVTVVAMGDPAPQYQWSRNGEPIPGATEATFHVESAENVHHGMYRCRVSNVCETLTTDEVLIRVFPTPCP